MIKSLKTIQTIHKVGQVISIIALVFSIIGVVGCAIGAVSLALLPSDIMVDGIPLREKIEQDAEMGIDSICMNLVLVMLISASDAALAYFARRYFDKELKTGTPFTFEGARELQNLGILMIVVPIATIVVCAVVTVIAELLIGDIGKMEFGNAGSVALGMMFLIISVFCRYGAEVEEEHRTSD